MIRWLLFTTTELEQPLWRIARHTTLYPENKRLPGELALARDDFAAMANVLEEYMSGRKFVVGNTATVGDFVLAYTLDWAKLANVLDGLPRLEAYMEEMYARPHAPMRIKAAFASIRALSNFCGTPIHSNVAPPLDAARDRYHPRQECSQDRDDHTQFNLIRL